MTVSRVLIANRGEIAVRIVRACQQMGIATVLAVSDADRDSLAARLADRTICIGPANAADSYLSVNAIVTAALGTEADAVHPGYGFLAESPELADACATNGLKFIGPQAEQIRQMGNKVQARILAIRHGVPTVPGSEKVHSAEDATEISKQIGLPVMLKAAAGGGGRGMKVVNSYSEMQQSFTSASAEARSAFGDDTIYLERYIPNARHIEVQILGDCVGNVIHLGERDCSLQRRHQKVVEEAPAPAISTEVRDEICRNAVSLAQSIRYESAGTVEFIFDQDSERFYFLEMNTRIQVEHPVSEIITGIDLIEEQIRVARGEPLRYSQADIIFRGHAIECRINAEQPREGFRPCPGQITAWVPPEGPNIRLDTHCYTGYSVPIYYDSLLAKLVVYGSNRTEAIERMRRALGRFSVLGIETTIPFLHSVMSHRDFIDGKVSTHLAENVIREMFNQAHP